MSWSKTESPKHQSIGSQVDQRTPCPMGPQGPVSSRDPGGPEGSSVRERNCRRYKWKISRPNELVRIRQSGSLGLYRGDGNRHVVWLARDKPIAAGPQTALRFLRPMLPRAISRQALVGGLYLLFFVVTGIAFLRWIYFANYNTGSFGTTRMHFTPGWAVRVVLCPDCKFMEAIPGPQGSVQGVTS